MKRFIRGTDTKAIWYCKFRVISFFSFVMALLLQNRATPTPIALLSLLVAMKILASLAQNNTDSFIYNGFTGAHLQFDGTAAILPNGLLQLSNLSIQKMGHAFYPFPLEFSISSSSDQKENNCSFSTTFVFALVPWMPERRGHGVSFTISPSPHIPGALPDEYLGLFNASSDGAPSNHIFAVELDTSRSHKFGDTDHNHVGIDVNSLTSIQSAPAAYFSPREGKNISLYLSSGDPMQIWIDYDGVKKHIDVALAPMGFTKPSRSLLSTALDLSLVFLKQMYVGFSASNGNYSMVQSSQYILGWSFNRSGQAQGLDLSRLPSLPRIRRRPKQKLGLIIGLAFGILTAVLITVVGVLYMVIRMKKYEEIHEDWEVEYGHHRFSYKDLYKATKGFQDKELLGSGGFGRVYKGTLPSSKLQVAIKRVIHNSQGMKQFVAEIASLGRLRHRNMVQLLGYCRRRGELLLVYDYMSNGSLDKYLFNKETPELNWSQRYKILQGVASALVYLHEEWEQLVLHRDVKASNVLLDAEFNGRLGDFGLARLYDHGAYPRTTHVVGTLGYLAPELTKTGKATTNTDVFAYGALMLEVACGRRPVKPRESLEKMILADWVHECWRKGKILEVSDPCLGDDYPVKQMELVLKLGLLCSHPVDGVRPSMRQVLHYLDGDLAFTENEETALEGFIASDAAASDGFSTFAASFSSCQSYCSIGSVISSGR